MESISGITIDDLELQQSIEDPNKVELTQEQFAEIFYYAMSHRRNKVKKIMHTDMWMDAMDFSKDKVFKWIKNPFRFERQLRRASNFLYRSNGQYKRLCDYQPNMVKMAYVITPLSPMPSATLQDTIEYRAQYEKTAYMLDCMNIRTEFNKVLSTNMIDGIAYAYARQDKDMFSIFMLDPDLCRTTSLDGFGCLRFEFDFAYFSKLNDSDRESILEFYGKEFQDKYDKYERAKTKYRWQEIGVDGICIKCSENILEYSIPPYIAVLDNLFDLEDYRKLAKAREETGNYNLINFTIPTNKDGKILMDSGLVKKFIAQASSEVPDTIGILYSPLEADKISFSKETTVADSSAVTEAVEQFWAAAGISELLFGSGKSSANALAKSIIADEINIYPLVRQIERWINRRLRLQHGKYKFKIKMMDVTSFNDKDTFDTLLKAGNAGVPVKNAIAAALGFSPYEVLAMSKLENDVLHMRDEVFNQPLLSSNTMASTVESENNEGGRPLSDDDNLTDEGESTRENEKNVRE